MLNLLPRLIQGVMVGGALANEGADQVVTQVTGATSTEMLLTYVAVALVQLALRWFRNRAAE